ncbi:MAG: glycosyltransferase [Endomicrobiales bacterium]|nr:glycosyltransferase [Endomicrobiales bacterium]
MAIKILAAILLLSFLLNLIYLVATFLTRIARSEALKKPLEYPKVSILKPMKGLDDGLEANLESFFTLDYPDYEIVFGLDTVKDVCCETIKKVSSRHPGVSIKILETGRDITINPKIDKLARISSGLESGLYWVSDANTRVEKSTLKELVAEHVNKGSKIVFSPLKGSGGGSLGSMMSNSYLNCFVSGNIIASWFLLKTPIIVGKSMLIEKNALDGFGGFLGFKRHLAEDYIMGEVYKKRGIMLSTNYVWITNFTSSLSVKEFYCRMVRWAKMRFTNGPFFYCLEIAANPIAVALAGVAVAPAGFLRYFVFSVVFKIAVEYLNLVIVNPEDARKPKVLALCPVQTVLKDLMLLVVYFLPFFDRSVTWHGLTKKIGYKSTILEA